LSYLIKIYFVQVCHKVNDDRWYGMDSARELVMIHDELLAVRVFAEGGVDISFMLQGL